METLDLMQWPCNAETRCLPMGRWLPQFLGGRGDPKGKKHMQTALVSQRELRELAACVLCVLAQGAWAGSVSGGGAFSHLLPPSLRGLPQDLPGRKLQIRLSLPLHPKKKSMPSGWIPQLLPPPTSHYSLYSPSRHALTPPGGQASSHPTAEARCPVWCPEDVLGAEATY